MVATRRRAYDPGESAPKRRKTDEESTLPRVSRACRICLTEVPRYLCVLAPCGHAFCRACSLKLRFDALDANSHVQCSACRSEGTFALLRESEERRNDPVRVLADEDRALADAAAARVAYVEALQELSDAKEELLRKIDFVSSLLSEQTTSLLDRIEQRNASSTSVHPRQERMSDEAFDALQADLDERSTAAEAEAERAGEVEKEASRRRDEAYATYEDTKKHIQQLIERFKQENEDSAARGLRFSRACRACGTQSPPLRSFFPACGHAVCRECADNATATETDTKCPTCHKEGGAVPLFEELAES